MATYQRVYELDVAVVGVGEGFCERGVAACEFEEGFGGREAQETAEGVVAWDTMLPVAKEVDGSHISVQALGGGGEVTEEMRVVVVCDGAGVCDTKGIEGICEG